MRDRDRAQPPSPIWRVIADILTGRLARRLQALQAETERLADRVDDLERRVAHQDGQLKKIMDLLPRAMVRHVVDTDAALPPLPDRRKMH